MLVRDWHLLRCLEIKRPILYENEKKGYREFDHGGTLII